MYFTCLSIGKQYLVFEEKHSKGKKEERDTLLYKPTNNQLGENGQNE